MIQVYRLSFTNSAGIRTQEILSQYPSRSTTLVAKDRNSFFLLLIFLLLRPLLLPSYGLFGVYEHPRPRESGQWKGGGAPRLLGAGPDHRGEIAPAEWFRLPIYTLAIIDYSRIVHTTRCRILSMSSRLRSTGSEGPG